MTASEIMTALHRLPAYGATEKALKTAYAHVAMRVLGPAFEVVSGLAPECRAELKSWPEGIRISIGVLPAGPSMTVEKRGERLVYLGTGDKAAQVSILFKNLDSAMLVLTLYMGTVQAYNEGRLFARGDNTMSVATVRILDQVEAYLVPGFLLGKGFFRRPHRLKPAQHLIRLKAYALLIPAIVKGLGR